MWPTSIAMRSVDRKISALATFNVVQLLLVVLAFQSAINWLPHTADAESCVVYLLDPSLRTVHSTPLTEATAGEQFVVTTSIIGCAEVATPFVTLIEARNSKGITEFLGWQGGELGGPAYSAEIGLAWIPRHGGEYELRTIVISSLENPTVLSEVMKTSLTIAENQGKTIIVIPYSADPADHSSNFEPTFVKVVLGVNSTVVWTNGDNIRHRLEADPGFPEHDFVSESGQLYLQPGYSYQLEFTKPGLFHFKDMDRAWMQGTVHIVPQ